MPPPQALHNVPPSPMQTQIHYTQQLQYQNGQMPEQLHYTVQPPQQPFEMHNPESPEQQKGHGVKRRFNDVEVFINNGLSNVIELHYFNGKMFKPSMNIFRSNRHIIMHHCRFIVMEMGEWFY